jgi:hypothetical protein
MENLYTFIFLTIFIIICVGYLSSSCDYGFIEKFETYSYGPYNFATTGSDPLTFYQYPVYRNPYNYPFKFVSSYPYPYLTYQTNTL